MTPVHAPTAARRATGRSPRRALAAVLAAVLAFLASPATTARAQASDPVTYQGPTYPSASTAPTEDKPQSKLWFASGSWWALMVPAGGGGVSIHRLDRDAHTWQDTGVLVDDRVSSTGDALFRNGHLFVASRAGSGGIRLARLSPNGSGWTLDAGFPVTIADGAPESVTIDRDSAGTLWATWTQGSRVQVAWSTDDGVTFSEPSVLPVPDPSISADDISAVVAFDGQVGILWSDQQSDAIRFASRRDGDPVEEWTATTVLSGARIADDHVNIKSLTTDDEGRLFAVVKTSMNDAPLDPADPLIMVLHRDASGEWDSAVAGTVADAHTRPQIVVDAENDVLHVLMTSPEPGGRIYSKSSPLDEVGFELGRGTPFVAWSGATLSNVTVTKDPVDASTDLVALATDQIESRYYHAELDIGPGSEPPDTTAPTVPADLEATVAGADVTLTWSPSQDAGGVAGYEVLRNGQVVDSVTGTTAVDAGLANGEYRYEVRARDEAGNLSGPSAAVTVAVAVDTTAPTVPTDVSATATGSDVTLTWSPSQDATGVTGYDVLRDGEVLAQVVDTTVLDAGLANGEYAYRVRARDAAGNVSDASPAVRVTVAATRFTDVPVTHNHYEDIEWLADRGITYGVGDGTAFAPRLPVVRQHMAGFLFRLAGVEGYTPPDEPRFSDVPVDHNFYPDISWLAEEGITEGVGDGSAFAGRAEVTRGQMAAFLYRFAGSPSYTPESTPRFQDVPVGHGFYTEISWLADQDVTRGTGDGTTFSPSAPVTRQEMASFLRRFDSLTD